MTELTTEQKTQAIIEAQGIKWELRGEPEDPHILAVLLTPAGLKAIYGPQLHVMSSNADQTSFACEHCPAFFANAPDDDMVWPTETCAEYIAHEILHAWFTSNGDRAATIDIAYSLLPDADRH